MKNQSGQNEVNIGVDTGLKQLDIHVLPCGDVFSFENNATGIKQALKKIKSYKPTRIIIEATGRLEQGFVSACAKAKLPIVVANPTHVRNFAKAMGILAKTDELDAGAIALYGERIRPALTQIKPAILQEISDIVARRNQLLTLRTMETNRLHRMPKSLSNSIKKMLTAINKQVSEMDEKLEKLIDSDVICQERKAILMSVPGVGKVVTGVILGYLPEIGSLNNKQAAALIGAAPMSKESGKYQGKRRTMGGRAPVRTAMYMAMMSAVQHNPVFKAVYDRLKKTGKPHKVAIIACVRKMIVTLNAMIRDGAKWNPNFVR